MKTALICALVASVASAACSGRDGNVLGSRQSSDPTASLTVTPATDTATVDDLVSFLAVPPDSQPVTWTVSDATIVRIEGQSLSCGCSVQLRALRAGTATVTATGGGQSGSAQLVVMGPVATVTVSPPSDTVAAGDGASFIAAPRDAQGNALSRASVTWAVSDSNIARVENTVGQSAQVRGHRQGTTTITATSGGQSGAAQLVVTAPAPVASVTVTPPADTLVVGDDSVFFHATLRDAAGKLLNGRVVTWTVSDPSVIRIQYTSSQSVEIRALEVGAAILTATSEGKSGSAQVVATAPPPVASVSVSPPNDTVAVGDTVVFLGKLRDGAGNPLYGRSVTWSVGDASVARVERAAGEAVVLRALQRGTTTVTAASEGQSGSAELVVTAPAPVASITVTPSADTLVVGDSATFSATLRDAAGHPLNGRSVTWTVSDPSVARIDFASGQWTGIRALKSGSAVLTATSEGKSGEARITVR